MEGRDGLPELPGADGFAARTEAGGSGMVTVVALALHDVAERLDGVLFMNPEDLEALARTAIEATAEPTDDMLRAAGLYNRTRAREAWRAMIDAALRGGA